LPTPREIPLESPYKYVEIVDTPDLKIENLLFSEETFASIVEEFINGVSLYLAANWRRLYS
jgi:hypothetical protein